VRRALIIHGWESNPSEHWYLEEKTKLEELGYVVEVPEMPNSASPVLSEWLEVVEKFEPDGESILIGHSLGVPTILRFLEKNDVKIDKAILIAGFARELGHDVTKNFVDKPFDWAKIKKGANEFIVINQKNDPWVKPEYGKEIADSIDGKFILVEGRNHFDIMDLELINDKL